MLSDLSRFLLIVLDICHALTTAQAKKVDIAQSITLLLFSACSISLTKYWLYASVILSMYAKLSSHLLAVWERESSCTHARNCVYLSTIENSPYHQKLVSHAMLVCWWIKGGPHHFSPKLSFFFGSCHNFFSLSSVQIIFIPACCLLCVL